MKKEGKEKKKKKKEKKKKKKKKEEKERKQGAKKTDKKTSLTGARVHPKSKKQEKDAKCILFPKTENLLFFTFLKAKIAPHNPRVHPTALE